MFELATCSIIEVHDASLDPVVVSEIMLHLVFTLIQLALCFDALKLLFVFNGVKEIGELGVFTL